MAEPASSKSLACLPDEALVRCLNFIDLNERLTSASLVSKRLRDLCLAPQLLRDIRFAGYERKGIERLQALARFLHRHGAHVHRLTLHATMSNWEGCRMCSNARDHVDEREASEACVAACSGDALQELVMSDQISVKLLQLAALPRLQVLWLGGQMTASQLQLPSGLSGLTALRELGLRGRRVELSARLPPSLTLLHLAGLGAGRLLPEQLPHLTNLCELQLVRTGAQTAAALDAALPELSCVTCLELEAVEVPACLPQLTGLCRLAVVWNDEDGWSEEESESEEDFGEEVDVPGRQLGMPTLHASLRALTRLTCLVLGGDGVRSVPLAVAHLPRLERFLFLNSYDDVREEGIPQGPWLASLKRLGLPWAAARHSTAALQAAPQLQYLGLTDVPTLTPDQHERQHEMEHWTTTARRCPADAALWRTFWHAVVALPALRCFAMQLDEAVEPDMLAFGVPLMDELLNLVQRQPGVAVRRVARVHGDLRFARSSPRFQEDSFSLLRAELTAG